MGALKRRKKAVHDPRLRARAEKRARVRRGWTAEEDSRIWQVVHARSEGGGWSKLARLFCDRTDDALRHRYERIAKRVATVGAAAAAAAPPAAAPPPSLPPVLGGRGMWTPAETATLEAAVANFGLQWHRIAERLPGRSMRSVRHHYNRLQRGTSQVVSRSKGAERTPGEGQGQVQSQEHQREGESEAE